MSIEYGTVPAIAEPLTAGQQRNRRERCATCVTEITATDGNVVAHAVQTYRIF